MPFSSAKAVPLTGLSAATDQVYSDPTVGNVIYGETDHGRNDFFREFVSVNHLDILKKQNVSTIRIEMPEKEQYIVDLLGSGQLAREIFISILGRDYKTLHTNGKDEEEKNELVADLVTRAAERGIKVKFVDPMTGGSEVLKAQNDPDSIAHAKACRSNFLAELTGKDLEDIAEEIRQWRINGRVSDENVLKSYDQLKKCLHQDPAIASMIKELDKRSEGDPALGKAADGDGRTAFFYGSAHGAGIAQGFSGKSVGIAGVYPGESLTEKEDTPFFQYHYDPINGTLSEPFKVESSATPAQPMMKLGIHPR
jgi:hypothetical protein